jgi:hypothetical protein
VRIVPATLLTAAVLAGCGSSDDAKAPAQRAASLHTLKTGPGDPSKAPTLITFRRVRYEGATLRTLKVHADGAIDIDIPGGGAGWSDYAGTLKPAALQEIRRAIDGTPWRSLTRKKVVYQRSGAYFMLRRAGHDYIAMADGMSKDLVPVVDRLNGVLSGEGVSKKELGHRFYTP